MSFLKSPIRRRALLRGMARTGAVSVALPFLDCFLDDNGTALASGEALPVRFGTWYWGMGHTPGHAVAPAAMTGKGITFLEECKALIPYRDQINYYGDFNTPTDGKSNYVHLTGWVASRTGSAPGREGEIPAPTLDLLIADAIGTNKRFKTLDLTSTGNPRDSYTARSASDRAAAEVSPIDFYTRLFGPDFVDPNKADFHPDPELLIRESVLSAVTEQRASLGKSLGAADKARLDEYFTSIRTLEKTLDRQAQRPAPNEACRVERPPVLGTPERIALGVEVETVTANHKTLAQILAMALACDQTRVFNMVYSDAFSRLRRAGETYTHHVLTHEEQTDPKLGYQPQAFWFNCRGMDACATFIETLANVREGAGTLLDNSLVFASSETAYARIHSVDGLPIMTFGKAGGRIRTGYHVVGNADPITRVGLTMMQVMGAPIDKWGTGSLQTAKPITEILV